MDGVVRRRPEIFLMQDNAPSHSSEMNITEVQSRFILYIKWPACPHNLNSKESVWNEMKHFFQENYLELEMVSSSQLFRSV